MNVPFRLAMELREQPVAVGDLVEVHPGQTRATKGVRRSGWIGGVLIRVHENGIKVRYASGIVEPFVWVERDYAWRTVPS